MMSTSLTHRILVADDDEIILDLLVRLLARSGYQVIRARSGREAIEVGTRHRPDLALLDYRMPALTGLEAGKALYARLGIPFIILSSDLIADQVTQAAGEGALGVIRKPIRPSEICNLVQKALQGITKTGASSAKEG